MISDDDDMDLDSLLHLDDDDDDAADDMSIPTAGWLTSPLWRMIPPIRSRSVRWPTIPRVEKLGTISVVDTDPETCTLMIEILTQNSGACPKFLENLRSCMWVRPKEICSASAHPFSLYRIKVTTKKLLGHGNRFKLIDLWYWIRLHNRTDFNWKSLSTTLDAHQYFTEIPIPPQ